ncbi:MAG: methanogenesis marker 2 protein [Candidatus Freyarchaeum deiterrae]
MSLKSLAESIKNFDGVVRKKPIIEVTRPLSQTLDFAKIGVVKSFGEDSAVLDLGGEDYLLAATDGIWHKLLLAAPEFAGYCSVLVNVNDVVVKGGEPIALLDTLSIEDMDIGQKIVDGILLGCKNFRVPVVGGHLHPSSPTYSLSVTVLGRAPKDAVIYSDTAKPGDAVIAAVDLDGRVHEGFNYAWDSTSWKSPEYVEQKLNTMKEIAKKHLATAAKDISNPGVIGTLGMLLEASQVGGRVDVSSIPKPLDMDLEKWVKMYPGFGVIMTSKPSTASRCLKIFRGADVSAEIIGEVDDSKKLLITDESEVCEVFNFKQDRLSGKIW